jgi:hypothetical protein
MDSKRRTQILYDDPNSMFKSGKKIYLHELQGATLKTSKASPNQLEQELKTSTLVVELIQKLNSKLEVIIKQYDKCNYTNI